MVGPLYKKPEITLPVGFRSQIDFSDATSFADLPWWAAFDDRALQALVNEALANNYDLQVAIARIEQARAMVGVSQSEGKPQVVATRPVRRPERTGSSEQVRREPGLWQRRRTARTRLGSSTL
jgi:outer membrane protein TolC